MSFRIVQSKQNARLKELRQALAHPGRISQSVPETEGLAHTLSRQSRLAGIEGIHLLEEALRAGLRVKCVFLAMGSESLLDTLSLDSSSEVLLLPRELLNSVLTTEAPQPVAALVEPPHWEWRDMLCNSRQGSPAKNTALVLILAGLQDPGNLGTVLRSAEAFGASGVLSLPGTVSAWNPKAVRASAGSIFRLPLLLATAESAFPFLRNAGLRILTTAVQGAEPAHTARLDGPVALVIGNEGNGVAEEIAAQCDASLTIPCPGPVESLNASVAASILLYEAARQRSCAGPTRTADPARTANPARTAEV
jgi:TrmH family RNA methyltransferase